MRMIRVVYEKAGKSGWRHFGCRRNNPVSCSTTSEAIKRQLARQYGKLATRQSLCKILVRGSATIV